MWGFMYGDQFGLVGNINDAARHVAARPARRAHWMLTSIGNIVTWEFVGYNMLIFYSALRVVPASLYEAAEIDGAGQFRIIRRSSCRRSAARW
jgi:multiple sugar transport system permease protein